MHGYILTNGPNGNSQFPFDLLYVTDPVEPNEGMYNTIKEHVDNRGRKMGAKKLTKKVWRHW